jgi:hypothetical protein
VLTDPRTTYYWHEYVDLGNNTTRVGPDTSGLDVTANRAGMIIQVVVFYASQYHTQGGLHTGQRENDVRAALGEPDKVEKIQNFHSLEYLRQGITFRILDDPHLAGYATVYMIKVYAPQ